MTLWDLQETQAAVVSGFDKDIPHRYLQRLNDLGLRLGEKVSCAKRLPFGGPMVVVIGSSVYALARELAGATLVEVQP